MWSARWDRRHVSSNHPWFGSPPLRQVGSFQPRFEIRVQAHWRFSFRTLSRIWMSIQVGWSLLGRALFVDHVHGLLEGKPASISVRPSWRLQRSSSPHPSVGVSGGDSSSQGRRLDAPPSRRRHRGSARSTGGLTVRWHPRPKGPRRRPGRSSTARCTRSVTGRGTRHRVRRRPWRVVSAVAQSGRGARCWRWRG